MFTKRVLQLCVLIGLTAFTHAASAGKVLFVSDENDPFIYPVYPTGGPAWGTWTTGPFANDFSGFTANGGIHGLATHPVSHDVYAVFETTEDFHRLVRFDALTYGAYDVGNLGQLITGLAFDTDGTLYGVTSDTGGINGQTATPDSIFSINLDTAVATKIADLPAPDGFGDTIAFNPDDGKLYHWGGYNTQSFNRLNLATMMWENVGVPAGWPAGVGVRSFAYDSDNEHFIGYRRDEFLLTTEEFFTITFPGNTQATLAPGGGISFEGMTFLDEPKFTPPAQPASGRFLYGVNPNIKLISQVDPTTGADIAAVGASLDGGDFDGFNGLATDPTTGTFYAIVRKSNIRTERTLVQIDPSTGEAVTIGVTGQAIADIAFDNDGQLYGVSGDKGNTDGKLYSIDKVTAESVLVLSLSNNGDGEAIAFNTSDGLMYRFSGNASIESINLETLDVVSIPVTGDLAAIGTPGAATYDEVADEFLVHAFWTPVGNGRYYSATAAGATTQLGINQPARKGLAFSVPDQFTAIVPIDDINGNGSVEVGVAVLGSTRVHVRDGSTDALITDIEFGDDRALDIAVLPDFSGNGETEIAVLNEQSDGQVIVQIRDAETGNVVKKLFYGKQYEPVAMDVVADYSGNGIPEIAVLGSESGTDAVRVQLRDSSSNAFVDNVFLGTQSKAHDLVAIPDTSGNFVPELGILGVIKANDQVRMQIWDADTATFQSNVWFAKIYQPHSTTLLPDINSNGSDEIVAVGVDPATKNIRVQIRDSKSLTTHYNIWLGNVNEAVDVAVINDINIDGTPDIAVLLKTPGGTGRVRVQSGANGAFIRNLFYSAIENPVDLAVLPDYSGNTFEELAVLGESSGVQHVQILDTKTGTQVNRIDFP
jgi:hypothetical protein